MAESAVFSLASKILATIVSPAFEKAYDKGLFLWEARDDLAKLRLTIETIQAVLIDAEKKQQDSAAVKSWIRRLKAVLYDADDLFDEVATDDLLKQKRKVSVFCSKLNPVISRYSIAKRVKAIKNTLTDISTDMSPFRFEICPHEVPIFDMRRGQDPGCFVDAKAVIGRDEDLKVISEMVFDESSSAKPVIAVVGIGGMGKTTLAQLIYNQQDVVERFANRWFSCISDTKVERHVLGKILQSISGKSCNDLNVGQLQTRIRESIQGKKYLLVLDDVWEDDRGVWKNRMSLLSGGAKGSRIIVTTRLPSVGDAMAGVRTHDLKGLSEDDSWCLLKSLAFDEEYESDPRRESLGKKILTKCRGVPISIWSMGSLLHKKTILEWEAIEREDLPTLGQSYNDKTMMVLKLSYDHLPSSLKPCFAYCCLFPKDYVYDKKELMYLWSAQGYIKSNEEESHFMHLLRRGFFQEVEKEFGEIKSCKMHDLMHDLASYVAGDEINIVFSGESWDTSRLSSCTRHVSVAVDKEVGDSLDIPTSLLDVKSLRSYLFSKSSFVYLKPHMDELLTSFKLLRTLSLSGMEILKVSPSLGELKLLRYLDLSFNYFEKLPESLTNLVNLVALNLQNTNLTVLPHKFRKLTNLRSLNVEKCDYLRSMPVGIGELTLLQYLSTFVVGQESGIDALARMQHQLRGSLSIEFRCDNEAWDDCSWELPVSLQNLVIKGYPGIRIGGWGNNGSINNLTHLVLSGCEKIKYFPPLRLLPILKWLQLENSPELEFMEEEGNEDSGNSKFFPCLEALILVRLSKLKGWCRREVVSSSLLKFPLLSSLKISVCPNLELESFPLCPHLQMLNLYQVVELPPTIFCSLSTCPYLEDITIQECDLSSLQGEEFTSLRKLRISRSRLKSLHLAAPHLQAISVSECYYLESLHISPHLIVGLIDLEIEYCELLRFVQQDHDLGGCNWIRRLTLSWMYGVAIEQLLQSPSLQFISISECLGPIGIPNKALQSLEKLSVENASGLKILHLTSPHLQLISIKNCSSLTSIEVEANTSTIVEILDCHKLENMHIARPNTLVT